MNTTRCLLIWLTVYQSLLAGGTVLLSNLSWAVGGSGAPFFDSSLTPLSGTNYLAQLYAGKDETRLVAVGQPIPFFSGRFAGYLTGGLASTVEIPFIGGGYPAWVQVRAWETAGGSTFEQAAGSGHWTGISGVLYLKSIGGGQILPETPVLLIGLTYPGHPIIVGEPTSRRIRLGETADLSVVASGGIALSYQWYQGLSGDTNHSILGATNATYHLSGLTTNATFWVSSSTSVGSTNSVSATVTLFPTNAVFLSLSEVSGMPHLKIDSTSKGQIQVQSLDDSTPSSWKTLSTLLLNTNPFTFIDTNAPNETLRIYRTVSP